MCPILNYAAEVWGFKEIPHINNIQNMAIRSYSY